MNPGARLSVLTRPMTSFRVTGSQAGRLGQLWFRGLSRLRLYRVLVLTERLLAEPLPDLPLPTGFTVRRLTPDDVGAYTAAAVSRPPRRAGFRILSSGSQLIPFGLFRADPALLREDSGQLLRDRHGCLPGVALRVLRPIAASVPSPIPAVVPAAAPAAPAPAAGPNPGLRELLAFV